jgi:hypothetical protein
MASGESTLAFTSAYFPDRCWCVPKCRADPYSIGMLSSPWAA